MAHVTPEPLNKGFSMSLPVISSLHLGANQASCHPELQLRSSISPDPIGKADICPNWRMNTALRSHRVPCKSPPVQEPLSHFKDGKAETWQQEVSWGS